MKVLQFLAIFLLITAITAQTFRAGRKTKGVIGRKNRAVNSITDLCASASDRGKRYCNGSPDNQCDATGFVQCTGLGRGVEFDCGGASPNCVETTAGFAKCSARPASQCGAGASSYECFAEGDFPDPTNCKKYYSCIDNGDGFDVEEFECDDYRVFDPNAPRGDYCRFTWNSYCVQVDCKGAIRNILMVYPFFPRSRGEIVASCRGSSKPPLVFKCPAGSPAILNTLPVECQPPRVRCRQFGKYEFPGDNTRYKECVFTSRGWEEKEKSCLRNNFFNTRLRQCVRNPTNITTTTTQAPTEAPTDAPTNAPTSAPTNAPTAAPTNAPTAAPTNAPTAAPTNAPTAAPTNAPTAAPTNAPTAAPTNAPTAAPTNAPTAAPTNAPTAAPTNAPTAAPTNAPTAAPTNAPTAAPTNAPTAAPTNAPTAAPTNAPTAAPTNAPTNAPTAAPTNAPTAAPTNAPTAAPTNASTAEPTAAPTNAPTAAPTNAPTSAPTNAPTRAPQGS